MGISRYSDHSSKLFLRRTVSAQLHAIGFILAIMGMVYLLPLAARAGSSHLWASATFCITAMIVFATSSTYHFLHDGFHLTPNLIHRLESIDHFAIYLFIAGTYSPFLLHAVAPEWHSPLLMTVWATAIVGIFYSGWKHHLPGWAQRRAVYTSVYVLMGLMLVVRIQEIYQNLPASSLLLLAAGGLSYVVGAVIYATKRPRLLVGFFGFHELWHVLVMLGFGFHYFMILGFYQK